MIISSTHSRSLIPYVDCCLSWNFLTFKSLMLWKFKVILSCMRRYMNTSDCATYGMNCISLYFLVIPLHSPLQNSIIFHKGLGHLFLRARTCHSIRCGARGFYNSVRMHLWIFFFSSSSRHAMRFWELLCEMKTDRSCFRMWHSKFSSQFSWNAPICVLSDFIIAAERRRNLIRKDIKMSAVNWNLAIKSIVYIMWRFIGWILLKSLGSSKNWEEFNAFER
jgi:hypothetical protein